MFVKFPTMETIEILASLNEQLAAAIQQAIDRGEGGRIWDMDGNEYIDLRMGYGPVILGHGDARVDDYVNERMRKGVSFSLSSRRSSWSISPGTCAPPVPGGGSCVMPAQPLQPERRHTSQEADHADLHHPAPLRLENTGGSRGGGDALQAGRRRADA